MGRTDRSERRRRSIGAEASPGIAVGTERGNTLGIRARAAIYVAITMIALAVVLLFVAGDTVTVAFRHLQHRDGEKSVQLVKNWMQGQAKEQARNAQSYGAWNATYHFIQAPDRAYIANNMADANLESVNVDFFVFVDSSGRIVYAKFTKHEDLRPEVLAFVEQSPELRVFKDTLASHDDIAGLPHIVVAIGSTPIVTSQSKGPIRGTLISGRFLDSRAMLDASLQIDEKVVWFPPARQAISDADYRRLRRGESVVLQPAPAGNVVGWGLVPATLEPAATAAVVRVPVDPTIASEGAAMRRDAAIGLVLFIVVSILALVIVMDTSVLRRLSSLMSRVREIGESDDPGERVAVRGRDEIGELATDINGMLEAIDRSRSQLLDLATHDALTGVFNRRRFEEELARELAESRRLERGGALLWFDLDNFKDVNDAFGHSVGDQVLISFAELLKDEMRAYSTLARFGGDEFVMLVPGTSREEALRAAERLLELFGSRLVTVGDHSIRLGTSIGVAFYPHDGETVESVLAAADAAMYESKRGGRGRVSVLASV